MPLRLRSRQFSKFNLFLGFMIFRKVGDVISYYREMPKILSQILFLYFPLARRTSGSLLFEKKKLFHFAYSIFFFYSFIILLEVLVSDRKH